MTTNQPRDPREVDYGTGSRGDAPYDVLASLAEASTRHREHCELVRQLEAERLELVRLAREAGCSHAQIAGAMGISRSGAARLAQRFSS